MEHSAAAFEINVLTMDLGAAFLPSTTFSCSFAV